MTNTLHQEDFMTELLKAHPHVGRLAWFTVSDGPVDQATWFHAIVQAGLAAYGTPSGIASTTAYLRGLRAMQLATSDRTLIRRVTRERGRSVHHWIEETVHDGQVHFRTLAAIERFTKDDRVVTHRQAHLTPSEDEALARLPEWVEAARRTYTMGDRRRQVRQWLTNAGALKMVSAGPVQFIPDTATGLLDALSRGQADLGVQVWSMPVTRSHDVISTLTHSLDAEVTHKTAALLKKVQQAREAGKSPTTAQQAKLVEDLRALDSRIQQYASLFGDQLDNLTQQIAVAKQAVKGALVG